MLFGWYPTFADGHGLVSIVCTTSFLVVSITETVSSFVLATNSALPLRYIAVGCSPTAIDPTAADGFAVSMVLTVSGRRRAVVPVSGHLGAVGVHGRVAGLAQTATLVAHVELAAHEAELTRGNADVPLLLDRTGGGVERRDGVSAR